MPSPSPETWRMPSPAPKTWISLTFPPTMDPSACSMGLAFSALQKPKNMEQLLPTSPQPSNLHHFYQPRNGLPARPTICRQNDLHNRQTWMAINRHMQTKMNHTTLHYCTVVWLDPFFSASMDGLEKSARLRIENEFAHVGKRYHL